MALSRQFGSSYNLLLTPREAYLLNEAAPILDDVSSAGFIGNVMLFIKLNPYSLPQYTPTPHASCSCLWISV